MASPKTFVDTSGFYCALSADESQHEKAKHYFQQPQVSLITTDWIIGETVNLLTARRKHHVALRFLDALDASEGLQVVHVDENLFGKARRLIARYREHAFPFTDCTSFVAMKELRLTEALTKDRHFRVLGFNPLLAG